MNKHPHDTRSPEDILKAQRMMVVIFGVATLMPALWMAMMAWSGFTSTEAAPTGGDVFLNFVIYWGLAAPVVWLAANAMALIKIYAGDGEGAKHFPVIPASCAIIWFAAQIAG